jgi:endonuclease/exonuclease/phosphatase family metal-dependent hydrolase
MWLKVLVAAFFVLTIVGAFVVEPGSRPELRIEGKTDDRADHPDRAERRLRILSWNIGNGDLESDTRAHTEDLPAVATVIMENDADAVALQELTGNDQLKLLLAHLKNRYSGYVTSRGSGDRVEAVLVRKQTEQDNNGEPRDRGKDSVTFSDVPAGDRFATAATFRLRKNLPEIVLVSAHADAFSAARRRAFAADATDWARHRTNGELTFIAGDFNFEVSTRNKNNLFTDDAKHDSESYAYLLKYFADLGSDAGETSINDRRIDYVFGPLTNVWLRRAEVLRQAAVGRMDHWPLLVEVAF